MQKTSRVFVGVWCGLALAAFLVGCSGWRKLPAMKIDAGDDGFVTEGSGGTYIDLAGLPIQTIFGAPLTGSAKVVLQGKPLSSELGEIDTIIQRPKDIVVNSRSVSGELVLRALNLVSVQPVSIGNKRYQLRIGLSDNRRTGRVTFNRNGKFSSSIPVVPKLVFTPVEGGDQPVTIDCGAVACAPDGKEFVLLSRNTSFSVTPSISEAVTRVSFTLISSHNWLNHRLLKQVVVKKDINIGGDGSPVYKTVGSSNFVTGPIAH